MRTYWVAAMTISGLLAGLPVLAQTEAPTVAPTPAAPAPPSSATVAPTAPAPTATGARGADPNVSYPLKNGGTYQGPLNGQADPTGKFYKGYNRT